MRLLLFGKDGQVGSALCRQLRGRADLTAVGRSDVDLQDLDGVEQCILEQRPQVVINAAAYTAVDKAESETDIAQAVNADAPGVMAVSTSRLNAWLIHYSTDYVFDGCRDCPYTESCDTAPLNIYGRTKLAGEEAIKRSGDRYLILRTSWVYALMGRNFLNTVLRLAQNSEPLRIVDDQYGSPTCADAIANATVEILERLTLQQDIAPEQSGIYHMSCGGVTTWYGFANEIMKRWGLEGVRVVPVTSNEFPTPAPRPRYSVLSNVKLEKTFGIELPHWQTALADCTYSRS